MNVARFARQNENFWVVFKHCENLRERGIKARLTKQFGCKNEGKKKIFACKQVCKLQFSASWCLELLLYITKAYSGVLWKKMHKGILQVGPSVIWSSWLVVWHTVKTATATNVSTLFFHTLFLRRRRYSYGLWPHFTGKRKQLLFYFRGCCSLFRGTRIFSKWLGGLPKCSGAGFFLGRPRGLWSKVLLRDHRWGFNMMDLDLFSGSILTLAVFTVWLLLVVVISIF